MFALIFSKLRLNELEVVPQRLHIGIDLLFGIAGQEAQITIGQSDNGAGQNDLVKFVALF